MSLQNHVKGLVARHRALDDTITAIENHPHEYWTELRKLKKRRLALKQKIARHEATLHAAEVERLRL